LTAAAGGVGRGARRRCLRRSSATWRRAWRGGCISAGLEPRHADDLVSVSDSYGEGPRSAGDDGEGAVVGPLERLADRVVANPDEAGVDEVCR